MVDLAQLNNLPQNKKRGVSAMKVRGGHVGVPQGSVLELLVQHLNNLEEQLNSEVAV